MREHEWKWSRRNRSRANIWSKFGVQLPWTTSSPPVKGDYHVWSDTGSIRHGAVVCQIVNWKGLNAYSVTSPLNIWTKFGVWLPRTVGGPPLKDKILSYPLFILLSEPRSGVELLYEIVNSETREHEWKWSRWDKSWANVWSKSGVQLPWTTSSPPVKGDYHVWSDTGSIRHDAVVCRIVNWKGQNACNVTSPLNILTKFGSVLPEPFMVDPPQEKIVSYLFSILLSGGVRWGGGGG